jgi:hypothetical protein
MHVAPAASATTIALTEQPRFRSAITAICAISSRQPLATTTDG